LYIIYNIALIILAIIFSPVILIAFLIKPKLRAGFWHKMGFYYPVIHGEAYRQVIKRSTFEFGYLSCSFALERRNLPKQSIWFHAVSVGEINAIEALIKKTKKKFPEYSIAITTTTKTGQEVAKKKLKNIADIITYFPYDFSFSVQSAIKALNPKIVVIAETEIWPCFCKQINKAKTPLILVNGRISPNSYKGYKKFRFLFEKILGNFSSILMQTETDRERIIDIGAKPEKVEIMGNLKFDLSTVLNKDEIKEFKKSLKIEDNKILIAGSTHKGEDEIIISVYKKLKTEFKDLKLIIAPRHPERNCQVLKLICATGFNIGLRSKNSNFKHSDIILIDTMGELSKLYSVADVAFIGGSFSGTGGHNPLEAAIYGIPVFSGPTVYNFKDIYGFMTKTPAAILVEDELELSVKIRELFKEKEKYLEASKACTSIFESNKGALDFAIERMEKFFLIAEK